MGPPKLFGHLDAIIPTHPWPIKAPLTRLILVSTSCEIFLDPPTGFQPPGSLMHSFPEHRTSTSTSYSLACSRLGTATPS